MQSAGLAEERVGGVGVRVPVACVRVRQYVSLVSVVVHMYLIILATWLGILFMVGYPDERIPTELKHSTNQTGDRTYASPDAPFFHSKMSFYCGAHIQVIFHRLGWGSGPFRGST